MDLDILRYFVTAAELQHISHAAEALYISQPSLSAALKRLEKSVGMPLFEKDGRGVRLTTWGKTYYDRVKLALEIIDDANNTLGRARFELDNTLNLFGPSLFAFPGLVDMVSQMCPSMTISHIAVSSFQDAVDKIKDGTLDILITRTIQECEALTCIKLVSQELMVFVGPSNPYYSRDEITLTEFLSLPYVAPSYGTLLYESTEAMFSELNIHPHVFSRASSTKDQLYAIANSNCVAIHARHLLTSSASAMSLHGLRLKEIGPIHSNLNLYYSEGNCKPARVDATNAIISYFESLQNLSSLP